MPVLSILYFNEQSDKWTFRRPLISAASSTSYNVLCIAVGTSVVFTPEIEKEISTGLSELEPTFVVLSEFSSSFHTSLMEIPLIRKRYGVTELLQRGQAVAEEVTQSFCCVLVASSCPVSFAESGGRDDVPYTFMTLSHVASVPALMVGTIVFNSKSNVEGSNVNEKWISHVSDTFRNKCDPDTLALIFSNCNEGLVKGLSQDEAKQASLKLLRRVNENLPSSWYAVAGQEPLESYAVWMKGDKKGLFENGVKNLTWTSFKQIMFIQLDSVKKQPVPQETQQTISSKLTSTLPAPESGSFKVDARSRDLAQDIKTTEVPAVKKTPLERRCWSNHPVRAYPLRYRLDVEESAYDQSNNFGSREQAVKQLNNGKFVWPFDYIVLYDFILSSHRATPDYRAFKRYVVDHANEMHTFRIQHDIANCSPRDSLLPERNDESADQNSSSPDIDTPYEAERLSLPVKKMLKPVWSERSVTVLAEKSMLESMFDITPHVGIGYEVDETLRKTVMRLNQFNSAQGETIKSDLERFSMKTVRKNDQFAEKCSSRVKDTSADRTDQGQSSSDAASTDDSARDNDTDNSAPVANVDPLSTYSYNYAVFYNPKLCSYMLLASAEVPCDPLACRAYAINMLKHRLAAGSSIERVNKVA